MAGVGSDRMHAAPCTRAHTYSDCLQEEGPARRLCVKHGKLPRLPKSNVSGSSPLQRGGLPEVPLYLGSSFNVIYAFCARNCGIFPPHGKQYGNVKKKKKSTLPAVVPVRVWATRRGCRARFSERREAAGKTRARTRAGRGRGGGLAGPGSVPGAQGRGPFKGGRGGRRLLSPSRSRGRAALRPLDRGTCPGDRPATSLEGARLKIRTKIQSPSVSGCAEWPGNFLAARRPRCEGARTARERGRPSPVRPGPARPGRRSPMRLGPRGSAGLGGGAPARGGAVAARRGPEAGRAQRGPVGLHVRAGGGGRADRSRPAP